MKLIIGLGNPGDKYEKTRHNLGFQVIDELKKNLEFRTWNLTKKFNALISEGTFNHQKIILAKPQTFMNNSGQAVRALTDYYKISPEDILIIHDDIDLPLEEIRIQKGRGSAGHKGVQSIIDQLGTKDFIRMRIGIRPNEAPKKINAEQFVLQKFTAEEEKIIQPTIKKAAQMIVAALGAAF
jgi:PTH1 family peptidyl-tRNA hydrolase